MELNKFRLTVGQQEYIVESEAESTRQLLAQLRYSFSEDGFFPLKLNEAEPVLVNISDVTSAQKIRDGALSPTGRKYKVEE